MAIEHMAGPKPMTEVQKGDLLALLRAVPELRALHEAVRSHFMWEDREADTIAVDTDAGPVFTEAKAQVYRTDTEARVVLCVPFPSGKPTCAQCESAEITHTVVYEVVSLGETSTAFGCLCTDCAKDVETELKAGKN